MANGVIKGLSGLTHLRALSCLLAATASNIMLVVSPLHAQTATQVGAGTTGVGSQFESQFWASVDGGSDPALYEAYLAKYPNGTFADVARIKILKLRGSTQSAPVPAPVPVLVPTPAEPALSPQVGMPFGPQQGTQASSSQGKSPTISAPPQQSPGQMQNAVLTVPNETSERAPLVPNAPPTDGDGASTKLQDLLNSIRGSGEPQVFQGSVPPPQPPALSPAPNPGQAPPVAQGTPYGPYSGSTGDQRTIVVGTLPPDFVLPRRPILVAVPTVTFPPNFCSAEARNAFHNNTYRPAVEAATRNNDAAGGFLRELQAVYDHYNLSGSPEPQNAVAAESRAYKTISDGAFAAQSALVSSFKVLMAVPIISCDTPK